MSNSLQLHELQHIRPPCLSPTPGVCSNSCPLSRWCHPAISSSVVPFSSCPQPLPASESFPMSQLFAWGGQSTGVSALASFLPKNTQDWSPLGWTGWISLQSKGLSRVFSNTTVQKHQFFGASTDTKPLHFLTNQLPSSQELGCAKLWGRAIPFSGLYTAFQLPWALPRYPVLSKLRITRLPGISIAFSSFSTIDPKPLGYLAAKHQKLVQLEPFWWKELIMKRAGI